MGIPPVEWNIGLASSFYSQEAVKPIGDVGKRWLR
jgi:hypothetical protein